MTTAVTLGSTKTDALCDLCCSGWLTEMGSTLQNAKPEIGLFSQILLALQYKMKAHGKWDYWFRSDCFQGCTGCVFARLFLVQVLFT